MSLHRHLKRCLATVIVCAATSASAQGPPGGGPPPPPEVSVITVTESTVPISFEFVGVTQASKTVEVRARVQGFLESRDFEEGSVVQEGATLWPSPQTTLPFGVPWKLLYWTVTVVEPLLTNDEGLVLTAHDGDGTTVTTGGTGVGTGPGPGAGPGGAPALSAVTRVPEQNVPPAFAVAVNVPACGY